MSDKKDSKNAAIQRVASVFKPGQRVPGRAYTLSEKKALLDRVLTVWSQYEDMRLGQLLSNAVFNGADIFNIEDDALCEALEKFLSEHPPTQRS